MVFFLTFHVIGAALSDWLSIGIDVVTNWVDQALTDYGINPVVHSLVIDGIFTLKVEDQTEELYPCDAAHFSGKTGYTYWNSSPFTTHVFCAKKKSE